jgi:hypothetical protein
MSDAVVIVVAVAGLAIRLALSAKPPSRGMTESDRVLRQQYRVPLWPIAELPDGEQGRLVGTTGMLHRTLTAPLSGRACLYYVVLVKPAKPSGARELFTERNGVTFKLEDTSGSAIIDPARASVALAFDHCEEVRPSGQPSPAQRALLLRHGHTSSGSPLRFVEAVLSVGERITVAGSGVRRPDLASLVASDYRSPPPPQLQLAASDASPLSICSQYVQ